MIEGSSIQITDNTLGQIDAERWDAYFHLLDSTAEELGSDVFAPWSDEPDAPYLKPVNPTSSMPGTEDKVRIMEERVQRGESPFCPSDPSFRKENTDDASVNSGELRPRQGRTYTQLGVVGLFLRHRIKEKGQQDYYVSIKHRGRNLVRRFPINQLEEARQYTIARLEEAREYTALRQEEAKRYNDLVKEIGEIAAFTDGRWAVDHADLLAG